MTSPQQLQQLAQQNASIIQQIKAALDQDPNEVDADQVKKLVEQLEHNNQQLTSGEQPHQQSTAANPSAGATGPVGATPQGTSRR